MKLLNHRRIKQLIRPGLGFKSFTSTLQTIAGYEAMAMIRKGQVASASANDMRAQIDLVAALSSTAA
jgi:IS6 family transposase